MQPMLIKVNVPQKASFSVTRSIFYDGFPGVWHFHNEYELTLIVESSGSRMVGDNIDRFTDGDLIFIGKNLPHTWRNDEIHAFKKSEVLVLHFLDHFLGNGFFELPEMEKIRRLMDRSHRGIRITGKTRDEIALLLVKMEHAEDAEKIILLLTILNLLTVSDDLSDLSSEGFANSIDDSGSDRLNQVYEYIMNHFQEDISLVKGGRSCQHEPNGLQQVF